MTNSLDTIEDVRNALDGVRTAMVTTVDERGTLSARPLTVQEIAETGDVWFLVDEHADWVPPADMAPINAAFAADDLWVSFAGRAAIVRDRERIDELKDAFSEAYFADDASPVALRVAPDEIEWWRGNGSVRTMIEVAKSTITGGEPDLGDSGSIEP